MRTSPISAGRAIAFAAVVVVQATTDQAVGAQVKSPVYTVRHLCFRAEPKPNGTYGPGKPIPFAQQLSDGSPVTLAPTAEAFLERLRRDEPRFNFALHFAGSFRLEGDAPAKMSIGAARTDPTQSTAKQTVTVVGASAAGLVLRMEGEFSFVRPGQTGREAIGWNGVREHVVPGRTYSRTQVVLPNGARLLYVFGVFPSGS